MMGEENEEKYKEYTARRAEKNLRTLALGCYVYAILKEEEQRASVPVIFTNEKPENFSSWALCLILK